MKEMDAEFNALLGSATAAEVERIIGRLGDHIAWVPLGKNRGNYGIIRTGADPYGGITERITNAIDAMIEMHCELRPEFKECENPRRAVEAIFGFADGNLRNSDQKVVGELASNIRVKFLDGDDPRTPTIEIRDHGIGQHPSDFSATLVSLNEDYKVSKLYLMGAFGQGGQTSFAHADYGIVVSRKHPGLLKSGQEDLLGWTIVRYRDPTTASVVYKRGYWEYCVSAATGAPLTTNAAALRIAFEHGTLIRLVSYRLPKGTSDVLQPASTAWGFLSQSLFDPLLPFRLYEARADYQKRNRAVSGLARRLWGGGREEKARIWKSDSYKMNIEDGGFVKINYWAIAPTDELENWHDVKKGYVSGNGAVFITLNGQTHGVETTTFLRDRVGLTYANDYVVAQIDIYGLTNRAKKELLTSIRERLVEGEVKERLMEDVVQHLRQDRNLLAFEQERKTRILSAKSERDTTRIRAMVSRYISRNAQLSELIQARGKESDEGEKKKQESLVEQPRDEIEERELEIPILKDIPTFLLIANKKDPIPIEKGGSALVRLETDAVDTYWEGQLDSHFRAIHTTGATIRKSCSELRNGKISYYVHCPETIRVGTKELLRFELDLPGGSLLRAERPVICVAPYDREREPTKLKLPEPKITAVSRLGQPTVWASFSWDDDSVGRVVLGKADESGIFVSLDNRNLQKALQSKRLREDSVRAVEERYLAGVAFYLLLKKVDEMKGNERELNAGSDESADGSPELRRLAETIAALALPPEAL